MKEIRQGDLDKLSILFDRHHRPLYNLILWQTRDPDLSEDMVQEVFYRILKFRHSYRGSGSFRAWMGRIAHSVQMDHYRTTRKTRSLDQAAQTPHDAPLPDKMLEDKDHSAFLHRALQAISSEKREVLLMSRFQNLKYSDIARSLGCSVGTVKSRVHWALKDLARAYQNLTSEPQS